MRFNSSTIVTILAFHKWDLDVIFWGMAILEIGLAQSEPIYPDRFPARSFTSSVKIPTLDGMLLTIAFSSNYRKCAPENEDAIVSLIGQERYEKYFGVTNTIKVKADIAPQHLQELIDRVGAEDFAAFFEVSTNIKPNEMFKAGQFFDFKSEELKALEGAGVVPYKPSIKL